MIKNNTIELVKKSQWSASINLSKSLTDNIINKDSINKINWSLILKNNEAMCLVTFNDNIPKNYQILYFETRNEKLTNSEINIPMVIVNLLKIEHKSSMIIIHHVNNNNSVICLKMVEYHKFNIDKINENPLISFKSKVRKNTSRLKLSLLKLLREITDIKANDILTLSIYNNNGEYKFIIEKLDDLINYPKNNEKLVYRTIEKVHNTSKLYTIPISPDVVNDFNIDTYNNVQWDIYQDDNRKFYIEISFQQRILFK